MSLSSQLIVCHLSSRHSCSSATCWWSSVTSWSLGGGRACSPSSSTQTALCRTSCWTLSWTTSLSIRTMRTKAWVRKFGPSFICQISGEFPPHLFIFHFSPSLPVCIQKETRRTKPTRSRLSTREEICLQLSANSSSMTSSICLLLLTSSNTTWRSVSIIKKWNEWIWTISWVYCSK